MSAGASKAGQNKGGGGTKADPKPRARYDRRTYEAILSGYREDPANVTNAARYAGVTREMARNAWHRGFPRQYAAGAAWARPIKEVLAEERDSAHIAREIGRAHV